MIMQSQKLFAVGELYPPQAHNKRIKQYRMNKKVFKGLHNEVFKETNLLPSHKDLLYVSVNLAGIICKKSADFLFGEELKVLAGKGEYSKEQEAFNRLMLGTASLKSDMAKNMLESFLLSWMNQG